MVIQLAELPSCYRDLAHRLDAIPNGFPATESGVELRLLSKLYTPEQATIAALLKLAAEPSSVIAARADRDPETTHDQLRAMARLGLIRAERSGGDLEFGLMPFVVGVYEAQLSRLDQDTALLFEAYFTEAFGSEVLGIKPSLHRIIAVEQSIPTTIEVFPYERASHLMRSARSFGVRDCICRVEKGLVGEACNSPIENCLVFHPAENAFARSRTIRTITPTEAVGILREASEAGLVHSSANVQEGHGYICNCCTCCCGILRGLAEFGNEDAMARADFVCEANASSCTGCQMCLDICPFGALSSDAEGRTVVLASKCMGCGLCISECPDHALSLSRRAKGTIPSPPLDEHEWLLQRARQRNIDLEAIL